MHEHRDKDLRELRERVANAEYRVDPVAVADAVVRRRWRVVIAPEPERDPANLVGRYRDEARSEPLGQSFPDAAMTRPE